MTYYSDSKFSLFGTILFVLVILAVGILRKHMYVKICGYWIAVFVVLFPIVGFSQFDFSMHMILLSWAVISLLVMLMSLMFKNIPTNIQKVVTVVFAGVILWQLTTNVAVLNELLSYAARFNYVN